MPPRELLIIDDDGDIREVAKLSMKLTEGWTVMTANGGKAGISLICYPRVSGSKGLEMIPRTPRLMKLWRSAA